MLATAECSSRERRGPVRVLACVLAAPRGAIVAADCCFFNLKLLLLTDIIYDVNSAKHMGNLDVT